MKIPNELQNEKPRLAMIHKNDRKTNSVHTLSFVTFCNWCDSGLTNKNQKQVLCKQSRFFSFVSFLFVYFKHSWHWKCSNETMCYLREMNGTRKTRKQNRLKKYNIINKKKANNNFSPFRSFFVFFFRHEFSLCIHFSIFHFIIHFSFSNSRNMVNY